MNQACRQRRQAFALACAVGGVLGGAGGCDDEEESDCVRLCDRTVLCIERHVAPAIAASDDGSASPDDFVCAFDDRVGTQATCVEGCGVQASGPTARACVACLADRLTCSATASMRVCDVDCEPTMFVTGEDGEGALAYDYASWFFAGVDELRGITCAEDP
jgi:hypothetical protein